ncbi:MAG: phospholipase D-like domain-containing protein [Prolixibacteraceae bacterium]
MKNSIVTLFILVIVSFHSFSQETIATARLKVNQTITVGGIVTNGLELGGIRYFQDGTGGLAVYGYTDLLAVVPGDSIVVTGKLVVYNNLLEISPLTSVSVISSGNPLHEAKVVTIGEVGEAYEAQLIKIKNVVFDNAGSVFEGNKNYNFSANGETGVIRINKDSDGIIGQIVPSGMIDLVTICSQFSYNADDTQTGYQLLPRTMADFIRESSIHFTSPISISNLTKEGFTLSWRTNTTGNAEVSYGFEDENQALTQKIVGTVTADGDDFLNVVNLSKLNAGSIIFARSYTVSGIDSAKSNINAYATQSNSSGDIKVYFNTEVDHSVSKGVDAIYLNKAIDDTLIAYINRAQESIDFTIYNFNNDNISNISTALNAAFVRGVKVRIISCGTANNFGIDDLAAGVPYLKSPDSNNRDGIMHNKFVIFDAHSTNPNVPVVWTGATNFTDGQINTDPNNVIILQDQSLALAYELEFIEMWGSKTDVPDAANARYGLFKQDNTPHEFIIGGKRVECYFSPSDGTNQKLIEALNGADHDLSIATMLITRSDLAYSIRDAKERGVAVNILTNQAGNNTDLVNETIIAAIGVQHYVYNEFVPGIMHHKYAVIDQDLPSSDPTLITGSHNWSASANDRNDENTLIVHDETIANIYYQQFVKIFTDNKGSFVEIDNAPMAINDEATVVKNGTVTINVLDNDQIQSSVDLSIEKEAVNGRSYIPFTNPNVIAYQAQNDFTGLDSIQYRISYQTDVSLSAVATIYVTVGSNGITSLNKKTNITIYPNPVENMLQVKADFNISGLTVYSLNGALIQKSTSSTVNVSGLQKGNYLLEIKDDSGNLYFDQFIRK